MQHNLCLQLRPTFHTPSHAKKAMETVTKSVKLSQRPTLIHKSGSTQYVYYNLCAKFCSSFFNFLSEFAAVAMGAHAGRRSANFPSVVGNKNGQLCARWPLSNVIPHARARKLLRPHGLIVQTITLIRSTQIHCSRLTDGQGARA
jgi:hypothetical protein